MLNDKLRTRLLLVDHQLLLSWQFLVAVGESVRIRAIIMQVGKQVPLVVVLAEVTFPALWCTFENK